MTWTYYKRVMLDPERTRSLHRINDDPPRTETWTGAEWVTVPGDSLATRDQNHLIVPISEAEASRLTEGNEPRFEPVPDDQVSRMLAAWLMRVREPGSAALAIDAAEAWLTRHPRDWRVMTAIEQAQRFL